MKRIFPIVLLLLLGGIVSSNIGCTVRGGDETQSPSDTGSIDRGRFGDPYRIVGNFNEADPEIYPILSSDTLTIRVVYSGGCESHRLEVDNEVRDDTAFVWVRHDARNDGCEALIQDEVQTVLPEGALEASVIALMHPQAGPPQIVSR